MEEEEGLVFLFLLSNELFFLVPPGKYGKFCFDAVRPVFGHFEICVDRFCTNSIDKAWGVGHVFCFWVDV